MMTPVSHAIVFESHDGRIVEIAHFSTSTFILSDFLDTSALSSSDFLILGAFLETISIADTEESQALCTVLGQFLHT